MISIFLRAEMGWSGLGNAKCNIVDLRMVFDARSARRFMISWERARGCE